MAMPWRFIARVDRHRPVRNLSSAPLESRDAGPVCQQGASMSKKYIPEGEKALKERLRVIPLKLFRLREGRGGTTESEFRTRECDGGLPEYGFRTRESEIGFPESEFCFREYGAGLREYGFLSRESRIHSP
jgi:hypothetical protein